MSGIIDFSGETTATIVAKLNGANLSLDSISINGGYADFYNGGYANFGDGSNANFDNSYANFGNGSFANFDGGSYVLIGDGSNAIFNGAVYLAGLISESPSVLTGAGAIPFSRPICQLRSTGGMQAIALADGAPGQLLTIVHEQDGGSMVLTATKKSGWTTSITFNNVGDNVRLQFINIAVGWIVLSSRGAAVV